MALKPEFLALWLALTYYTSCFIAEIVRAGILAVSHGQTEASYALGLRPNRTLQLVIIPQALRIIVPPLVSQYLNLTKNSSLAIAIGYMDVVATIGGISLMQTGKEVETMIIVLGVYLVISLIISGFMNWFKPQHQVQGAIACRPDDRIRTRCAEAVRHDRFDDAFALRPRDPSRPAAAQAHHRRRRLAVQEPALDTPEHRADPARHLHSLPHRSPAGGLGAPRVGLDRREPHRVLGQDGGGRGRGLLGLHQEPTVPSSSTGSTPRQSDGGSTCRSCC